MSSVLSSVQSFIQMFDAKKGQFIRDIDNIHMVWLDEIQQEANHMFSRDFNAEPELMPKTPSQKKCRRKRVSVGRQEGGQAGRRSSKGRRGSLSGSSVKTLNFIAEDAISEVSVTESSTQLKHISLLQEDVNRPQPVEDEGVATNSEVKPDQTSHTRDSPVNMPSPNIESIPASTEQAIKSYTGRTAAKIAIAGNTRSSRRTSVRCSLKVRHSLAGMRHSMKQESLRRASRQSMMKRKAARKGNSSCSSIADAEASFESVEEADEVVSGPVTADPQVAEVGSQPSGGHITCSMDASKSKMAAPSLPTSKRSTQGKKIVVTGKQQTFRGSIKDIKSEASDTVEHSPIQSAYKPYMRSFLHTVQKNQMLMMSPSTFSRNTVIKSFFKHTTPLKVDAQARERQKLEALKKKQEQEEERLRKILEEKKKKQEESKRKKEEKLRKVLEAKVKEEQREEEKKKKIELKMAQMDEKNDKRQAEEKAKKRTAIKRQDELEQKNKLEEETRRKKIKQADEEEQLKAKELADACRLLELKRDQEHGRELERERQAAAEREKALALQRELERAAREKERRELEEKRKAEEEKLKEEQKQRLASEEKAAKEREAAMQMETAVYQQAANAQKSLQTNTIIPEVGNTTTLSKNPENYGMDLNSDDSTDDESTPRKPIPSWAEGHNLQQIIMKQYFNPPDLDSFFGIIEPPELESIFYKNKPRYFTRTSSAVWHSPPIGTK